MPQDRGFEMVFAALSDCTKTLNGSRKVPDNIATLVLKWTSEADSGTATTARSAIAQGQWLVKLPTTKSLDIELYGCSADHKVVWRGRANGLEVEEQKESKPARVFLVPVAPDGEAVLACAGGDSGVGALQIGRSLAGGAVLATGDVAVVGGIKDWNSAGLLGAGGTSTDVFDYRLGAFRKGPELAAPRILPHVHAIGTTQVLVAGGLSSVASKSTLAGLPTFLMAPENLATALPSVAAEVVDLAASAGQGVPSPADIGVGALAYSSSLHLGTELLFAGGVELGPDQKAQAVAKATRLSNLQDLIPHGDPLAPGPGVSKTFPLLVARARPAMLRFRDGPALIWGGAASKKASDMGEIIAADATVSELLTVTGDTTLLGNDGKTPVGDNLATVGAATAVLSSTPDQLVFLVVGGVPLASPVKAVDAPTYIVVATLSTKTAELKRVVLSNGGALRGGLGTMAVSLPDGQVLVAGGLIDLKQVPGLCDNQQECILKNYVLFAPPTSTAEASVTLGVLAAGDLPAARFGMVGLPLPAALLIAGGQSSVIGSAVVLDAGGRLMTVAPATASAICK
jgi:hypothetical protein